MAQLDGPTCGCADLARPCAPLGRRGKHFAVVAAGADGTWDFSCKVLLDNNKFYMGNSASTAARSLRSVRLVPWATWAPRGRASGTGTPPRASAPTTACFSYVVMGMRPRAPRRARPSAPMAAHVSSKLIFVFSA